MEEIFLTENITLINDKLYYENDFNIKVITGIII